jgi:ferrous iron transport protein B
LSAKHKDPRKWTRRLDNVLLHPVGGIVVLLAMLFVMFQAVYAWSEAPIGWIETGFAMLTDAIRPACCPTILPVVPDRRRHRNGVGAVVVFLPQILILFLFILLLEAIRLYDPRRLCDGSDDGGGRPVRA